MRDEDVPYVAEVVDYLKTNNLVVTLEGSAVKGDKKYNDVDLLARGNLLDVTNVVSGLQGLAALITPFPEEAADGENYAVNHVGGPENYVGNSIDERFKISVAGTGTSIDLCFKKE